MQVNTSHAFRKYFRLRNKSNSDIQAPVSVTLSNNFILNVSINPIIQTSSFDFDYQIRCVK